MSTPSPSERPAPGRPARSFGAVVEAYDAGRPGYPAAAATWLVGRGTARGRRVLELGAGTGKLTSALLATGADVLATDPDATMLARLTERHPDARPALASAEQVPLRGRTVDLVVAGQAFHWFDLERALPEIARVLVPGGRIALAWNVRDDRVPWVRRLNDLVAPGGQAEDPTHDLLASHLFGYVDTAVFRHWVTLDKSRLRSLVRSRSSTADLPEREQERVLGEVDGLYDGYGRGPDGLQLPYLTRCFTATVRPPA